MDSLELARRLVIKVGSALLVGEDGRVNRNWLSGLAKDIGTLTSSGKQVVIVTSGAVAIGRRRLGLTKKSPKLEEKQAAAAVGQIILADAWQEALREQGLETAQLLLTLGDTEDRRRYLNARATVETLLRLGVVPVVNENDTVATAEIRFGDNDRLSARVAVMAMAECLLLLSDVDGLYDKNPKLFDDATHIPEVKEITPDIIAMAGDSISHVGTGGMASKVEAARIATGSGCTVFLSQGTIQQPVTELLAHARCTIFRPLRSLRQARKDWIAGTLNTSGTLTIDAGAAAALKRGSSLLPAGVTGADGYFARGDAVAVLDASGKRLAIGLINYDFDNTRAIIGRKSSEIADILGFEGRDEIIHRDDLVLA